MKSESFEATNIPVTTMTSHDGRIGLPKCTFCKEHKIVYDVIVKDFYCRPCGKWQSEFEVATFLNEKSTTIEENLKRLEHYREIQYKKKVG